MEKQKIIPKKLKVLFRRGPEVPIRREGNLQFSINQRLRERRESPNRFRVMMRRRGRSERKMVAWLSVGQGRRNPTERRKTQCERALRVLEGEREMFQ